MSQYYNSQRVRGLYQPGAEEAFKLSRSKIDLFLECPRCFYYDRRLGVGRPPGFPFALNSAVDHLLKKGNIAGQFLLEIGKKLLHWTSL